jgi:DNA repair photolyase
MDDLEKSVRKIPPAQVLLNFLHDPYEPICAPITRGVIRTLAAGGFPVAVLSKCLSASLEDVNLFRSIPLLKIGTTLTCDNDADSRKWEPGADTPEKRLAIIQGYAVMGIKTFVSFEPVLYPAQTLRMIRKVAGFVSEIKIGRWNHSAQSARINWRDFGVQAVNLARELKLNFYVKEDLRAAMPGFIFTEQESNFRLHELLP